MDPTRSLAWVALLQKVDRRQLEATWMYPNVPKDHLHVLLHRVNVDAPRPDVFFVKYQDTWVYVGRPSVVAGDAVVVVASKCFDPEKYAALLDVLADEYVAAGSSPLALVRVYLALFTTGQYANPNTHVSPFEWNKNQAMAPYIPTSVTLDTFVSMFQSDDSAIVWLAILAKKRVVVTSDNIPDLLQLTRCLPQFAWHRQDWAILRPFTRGTSAEVADLCASGVYIAGMLHSDLHPTTSSSPLLYDVLVDVPTRTVTVATGCADLFSGLSWHNQCTDVLATYHHQPSTDDHSLLVDVVAKKTLTLIESIQAAALTSVHGLDEPLKWAVAVAEELV
ncbi:hypothetical protein, variant 1 [Aphanomyces astaci]|uniref:UDENN domain-containing protein n=1 Tax=Aphanomyces astaci TaxID=112090 RepID=W4FPY3_APHAT|nr:hypothetical protein, variant 1 [Aphanomyces astaci]ETV68733.1 hypothetical protein, variant 1 [Aphanomyces astaci]|eukprot:XP_009841687.1 hypothetical protein, variant 1 [Aphanomyces astaci]